MLETLSKGFRTAREQLAGVTELSESNIEEALRQVRLSLLEADVEFKVTKNFLERVKDKALGETVKLRARAQGRKIKVSPSQHFVKICQDELAALMGPADPSLNFAKKGPTCIMMVGLQGSGKTTTTAKLARYLEKKRRKPMLVAADVYRPAAVEQLKVLGERLALPVHAEPGGDPPAICEHAMQEAHRRGRDVVLLDTAGRLAIDEPLMQELEEIKLRCRPANIFLVVDAMMGQDAVRTAQVFHQRLTLSGVILTKLDGDARGGAALSIKAVTGAPIKFLGIGESLDKLEEFRPEGLASRILGMGDVVGLMRDFEDVVDAEQAEREAMEMLRGKFDMSDFLKQIKTIKKMGSLADLFDKMPFFPNGLPEGLVLDDRELPKIEAVIHSMTEQERRHPELFLVQTRERPGSPPELQFNSGRVKRVARGAGRTEREVHELLEKFSMMKQMMLEMGSNLGLIGKIPGLKQLAQLKQMAGLDVNKLMETMGMPGGAEAQPRRHFRPPQTSVSRAKAKHKRKLARDSRKKRR